MVDDLTDADGVAVVVGVGELDLATCPALRHGVVAVLDRCDCRVLIVDLSRVEFLSAAGLGLLVETRHRAVRCGVELRLVVCTRAVSRPLWLTGLTAGFTIFESASGARVGGTVVQASE